MGMTLRELIYGEKYCRGIVDDKKLKGFAPSGPSGGFLPAKLTAGKGLPRDHTNNKSWQALAARRGFDPASSELDLLDLELELNLFRALSPTQALGAGLTVYAEGRDMAEQAVNSVEFFRNESCGKCVPCRVGSSKMTAMLEGWTRGEHRAEDLALLDELSHALRLTSICGLGQVVPVPIASVLTNFREEVDLHLTSRRCAAGVCFPATGGPVRPNTGRSTSRKMPIGVGPVGSSASRASENAKPGSAR